METLPEIKNEFKVGNRVTVTLRYRGTYLTGVAHKGTISNYDADSDTWPYSVLLDNVSLLSEEEVECLSSTCLKTSLVIACAAELHLIKSSRIPKKYI